MANVKIIPDDTNYVDITTSANVVYSPYLPTTTIHPIISSIRTTIGALNESWPGHHFRYGHYNDFNDFNEYLKEDKEEMFIIIDKKHVINFTRNPNDNLTDLILGTVGEFFLKK